MDFVCGIVITVRRILLLEKIYQMFIQGYVWVGSFVCFLTVCVCPSKTSKNVLGKITCNNCTTTSHNAQSIKVTKTVLHKSHYNKIWSLQFCVISACCSTYISKLNQSKHYRLSSNAKGILIVSLWPYWAHSHKTHNKDRVPKSTVSWFYHYDLEHAATKPTAKTEFQSQPYHYCVIKTLWAHSHKTHSKQHLQSYTNLYMCTFILLPCAAKNKNKNTLSLSLKHVQTFLTPIFNFANAKQLHDNIKHKNRHAQPQTKPKPKWHVWPLMKFVLEFQSSHRRPNSKIPTSHILSQNGKKKIRGEKKKMHSRDSSRNLNPRKVNLTGNECYISVHNHKPWILKQQCSNKHNLVYFLCTKTYGCGWTCVLFHQYLLLKEFTVFVILQRLYVNTATLTVYIAQSFFLNTHFY